MEFAVFKAAVAAQFARLHKQGKVLFTVKVEKDDLWNTYLTSFPEGTNPMFRERTEYDCSCCRQFVRAVGDIVAIVDGKMESIWDVDLSKEPNFQVVANALSTMVKSKPIDNLFMALEKTAGTDRNFEQLTTGVQTWNHFFINIPPAFVVKGAEVGPRRADLQASHDVFLRSLNELTDEAVETVLELIDQNIPYRGKEHRFAVAEFQKLKNQFKKVPEQDRDLFVWLHIANGLTGSVARIRNTSIGTLLQDLSEGKDLEDAVKAFEAVVAPANYKRPTALVTASMIAKAKETVAELGLTSALERRYAKLTDITVNNVLFANRDAKKAMGGDVFDDMIAEDKSKVDKNVLEKVEEVHIDKFLADILPKASSIEVMMDNKHQANLVSLIAPVDPTAGDMFKWPNKFSWSYSGDLADSDLRKAVVERGGSVTGAFRFTHSWNYDKRNASLMDLHVFMPGNTTTVENDVSETYGNFNRVGWNNRKDHSSGGVQDVDYTNAAPVGYVPVENITFPNLSRMPEGRYLCKIHNWQFRTPTEGGFRAEIEFEGQIFQYEYDRPLKHHQWITVAEVHLKDGKFTIKHHLEPSNTTSREVWGLKTLRWQRVNAVMLSPNYWDDREVGNKHFFFMIDGCCNEGAARGFYNEFLKSELDPHRKVLEIVGSKMKAETAEEQLSGLGFSSTQRNELLVRVKGSFTRIVKILF